MAASPDTGDSSQLVITCTGNINDHDLTQKLQKIRRQLSDLSESDDESVSISKIEPWNSVRVTFNIPPEAAQRLQQLAQTDSQVLQNLGILSVQIENNDLVTIPPPVSPASIPQHVQPLIPVVAGHSVMSSIVPTSSPMRMSVANQQVNPLQFGGMRPNLPWGQIQIPRMQGNMPAGMQGNVGMPQGNIPAGMQPGIQAGIQLNMQQGIQQNMQGGQSGMHGNMSQTGIQGNIQPGMTSPNIQGSIQGGMPSNIQTSMQSVRQPGMPGSIQAGLQQGMHANMPPGLQGNIQGGIQPGMQGLMQGNIQPGMPGGIQPGMQGGMQTGILPGMQGNIQPGMQGNIQPGMQGNIQPGMQGNMQPGMQGNMQPGMQGNMQPGMQGNIQPGMQGNIQPGMQGNIQPGMQGNMQPGMQGGMQSNIQQAMQQGINPNVLPFNQMPQFFYQGEMPMQRFGHSMSPPVDARPKKKRRSRPKAKKKNADKEKDETDILTKDAEISQTTSEIKAIVTPPPINQMSPSGNSTQSATNQNQQVPTSLPFAEPTPPGSTTSTPPMKKPDVSITSPLLVNLLQREIPGTQFPFSNRGIPSSLGNTLQQGALNPKKPMTNLPQSTISQGLPPMPPASEITRMLPESIGLPPLPTNQSVPAITSQMSSPQTSLLASTDVRSQTPNRQQINMNQPLPTQQFQQPADATQMSGDATHNIFAAHRSATGITNVSVQHSMPTLSNTMATTGMPLQQPSSVLQAGLGVPFGQIDQSRRTPTPLGNNMSPPVRLSGMQSPGPNNLPFAAPGMINPNMVHGLPTSLQQAQALSSAGPTAVYQQGMNEMMHQGQRQFPTVTTQIRNQVQFPLQIQQQQSQINQLNQYFPSNINQQQVNPVQTQATNQGIDFPQGANFNPMFHQRPPVPGNMPFNMPNIPTSNLAQFRMPGELQHVSNKGMIPGNSGNVMQPGQGGMIPGTNTKVPVRQRGHQQMPHSTHLPPTNITFPSIPRFASKPQSKMVMPFDETTLDGISDAEKDLLAMAEKVANEAGMETSNRMANLFSKDTSRDNKQAMLPDNLLTGKDPSQLKFLDSVRMSAIQQHKDFKSSNAKQKKPPVIQLTKQHDMFMPGDTQNIASWSSTILPIHGKERYSLPSHTSPMSIDKTSSIKVEGNRFKSQGFTEAGPTSSSLNSQPMKSTFSLSGDMPSMSSAVPGVGVSQLETGAQYVSMPRPQVIPYQNVNFLTQFNPGVVPDKKLDNPPSSVEDQNRNKHDNIYGTNINASPQNFNQGLIPEPTVSEKSSILMQMMHMDTTHNNSGMINLTRSVSEPVGSHVAQTQNESDVATSDSKMPTLERMPRDSENNSPKNKPQNGTDVAELNAEYVAKPTVVGASQHLMPQLMPKQSAQQQNVMYSPKSLLLPSCMPPPGAHGSTGNSTSAESQKPTTAAQIDKRSRSVSPVTQQGGEFPRLPLSGGTFIKQTPSPTTSSPSSMGMSASALLSSIAKSAYNAGMTPRMQSPSETRPSTSQSIGLPPTTTTPSPTGLPLYANPLGPDANTKPITVRVSPVTATEVVKSMPLIPSVSPNVSQSSKISNEPTEIKEETNLTLTPVEIQQPPVTLSQPTHSEEPPELPVSQEGHNPEQTLSSNPPFVSVSPQPPIISEKMQESTPTVEHSTPTVCTSPSQEALDQPLVEEVISKSKFLTDVSTIQLKRKHEDSDLDAGVNPASKVLKVDSEVPTSTSQIVIEEDLKKFQNTEQTDSDGDLSGEHRPLPLLVRESTIEIPIEKDHAVDMSLDTTAGSNPVVMTKEVLTMPTLLPSKVELTDIAKCKDTHPFSFKLEDKTADGEGTVEGAKMPAPPKDLPPQNIDSKSMTMKEAMEAKQESIQMAPKTETPSASTSKSPAEISPSSSKDSTKSSPVERRTTPKRKAAEEASRPAPERTTPSRQCTLQVDEPPATRARRATRNKSPADHPTRLREREDSTGSSRDQHTDPPTTDNDARMTRKRSTRIIGKGTKDKDK